MSSELSGVLKMNKINEKQCIFVTDHVLRAQHTSTKVHILIKAVVRKGLRAQRLREYSHLYVNQRILNQPESYASGARGVITLHLRKWMRPVLHYFLPLARCSFMQNMPSFTCTREEMASRGTRLATHVTDRLVQLQQCHYSCA